MTGIDAPIADWVTIPDLHRDPFPIYERLRAEGGVHWVPQVNRYLITSYEAVHQTELDQETFSANEEGSLQIRAMGHSMLRRDDPEHFIERKAWQPALRPGVVKRTWSAMFRSTAEQYLDELIAKGPGADLVWDFAAPFAAESLRQVMGLYNATQEDLQRWSQTMIDATGNYADDPEVWARGQRSFDEVDAALDDMIAWHVKHPDHSLLSSLLRIPDYEMPLDRIRANLKMTIGGGLNEPRDAIGVAAWAMLTHPEQRAAVAADPSRWHTVFDETIRWVAPIGMYSRQTTREVEVAGVRLPAGAKLGICLLSANRDEQVWNAPEAFDMHREVKPHLAFGKGVHVCLGAWVARSEVADVALPMLFSRLNGLALSETDPAEMSGWVFRGMTRLPVTWESVTASPGGAGAGSGAGSASNVGSAPVAAGSGRPGDVQASAPTIAIVGAGPAGCFSAQALRRALPGARVDVFDEMPTPFGLVRYGVAADHPGTKAVARQFDRLFAEPGVRFRGNRKLGRDLELARLRDAYDGVVLATGMHVDAPLAVPGAHFAGVRGAGALTRHLNGHPDEPDPAPLGREVVVVGHGNVAMDVVRLIARDADGFAGSDIDDAARDRLVGAVRTVHVLGRSLPAAAKFDPVMVRELAGLPGVHHVVHRAGDLAGAAKDARVDAVRALAAESTGRADAADVRVQIEWWFGVAPHRIDAVGADAIRGGGIGNVSSVTSISGVERVAGVVIAPVTDGVGEETTLPATDVITAVGFAADADSPLVPGAHPDGRVEPGLYTAGWLRRGPRGTIPDQRADARELAQLVAEDLRGGLIGVGAVGLPVAGDEATTSDAACDSALNAAREVDFTGWRRIDLRERLGAAPGRERSKLRTRAEQLAAAADETLVPVEGIGAHVRGAAGDGPGEAVPAAVPVTILYGTESGGAELVAHELGQRISDQGGDVEVHDLADVTPAELDAARFHLVICSTYGDGEVPTAARDFLAAMLGDATPSLGSLQYAVFGMGDRSYERTYSRGSELIDEALAACGARRVGEYGRHDAGGALGADESARDWADGVLAAAADSRAVESRAALPHADALS